MTFRKDWCKAFVESPLAGSIKFHPGSSRVQIFDDAQLVYVASVEREEDTKYNVLDKIDMKKYPVVCPYCGAPHNPNEGKCEYCGGYMKEE